MLLGLGVYALKVFFIVKGKDGIVWKDEGYCKVRSALWWSLDSSKWGLYRIPSAAVGFALGWAVWLRV